MVYLAVRMYCNWPSDHAIDHSSIGLNKLTIQLVFNEVSLFTFSKGTHGFDVTVPKNYLNIDTSTNCHEIERNFIRTNIFQWKWKMLICDVVDAEIADVNIENFIFIISFKNHFTTK